MSAPSWLRQSNTSHLGFPANNARKFDPEQEPRALECEAGRTQMSRLFLVAFAWLALFSQNVLGADDVMIRLGPSVVALNGPWKFRVGDDMRWASPGFDDSHWEEEDLTPIPGAHDSDVGLENYVPGWAARGHRGYSGFAWYRMTVRIAETGHDTLWLIGPASVDNAYQVYINGHLLGGIGDLSRNPPSIVAIQPRLFAVPVRWWTSDGGSPRAVIAFRVAALRALAAGADSGGIRIAPLIGNEIGASDHYRLEWLQTVEGYTVDAVEAIFFLLLAVMTLSMMPFDRRNAFYPWLAATLVLLAAARGNQPVFFLGQFETFHDFVLWRLVVGDALTLMAWTLAWRACFGLGRTRWMKIVAPVFVVIYMIARAISTSVLFPSLPTGTIHDSAQVLQFARYAFLLFSAYIFVRGAVRRAPFDWMALVAMLFGAVGLFATEVNQLGIPGIWFPYGVGVSRTEYAYVAFDIALFIYLLLRLWTFAPGSRLQANTYR